MKVQRLKIQSTSPRPRAQGRETYLEPARPMYCLSTYDISKWVKILVSTDYVSRLMQQVIKLSRGINVPREPTTPLLTLTVNVCLIRLFSLFYVHIAMFLVSCQFVNVENPYCHRVIE